MSIMCLILVTLLGVYFQPMFTPDMHDLPATTLSSSVVLMSMVQLLRPRRAKQGRLANRFAIITMPCMLRFMSGLTVTLINLGVQLHQSKQKLHRISSITFTPQAKLLKKLSSNNSVSPVSRH